MLNRPEDIERNKWLHKLNETFNFPVDLPVIITIDYSKRVMVYKANFDDRTKEEYCRIVMNDGKRLNQHTFESYCFYDIFEIDFTQLYHGAKMYYLVTDYSSIYPNFLYQPESVYNYIKNQLNIDLSVSLDEWRRNWDGMTDSEMAGYMKWGG